MAAGSVLVQVRLKVIERHVPADIAVKFAVNIVARIADLGTPDLLAGFDVAGKDCHAVLAHDGSVNAVTRPRVAVKNGVRVADEVLDPGVL